MRLTKEVYVVGGGDYGFNLSHRLDSHVYVINGGKELALIDAGFGPGTEQILNNIREDALDVGRITKIFLTHYHADHAGGSARMRSATGAGLLAGKEAAPAIRAADADQIGLNWAKRFGFYPREYELEPCPVDEEFQDSACFRIGSLQLEAVATPGHCMGHYCLVLRGGDRVCLFASDQVFWGGAIVLQNVPDASVQQYAASMERIQKLEFEALLPGHLTVSLRNGKRHVDAAVDGFNRIGLPKSLLY
ncbi:MAG: MBL fold metallo-hydrolase [Planctomycetes bacterium]|nr:MBL fold metallo-hydrolase [Planctomycetota bacterium]